MSGDFLFSKRTNWQIGSNDLIRAYEQLKGKGVSLIDLTLSNSTQCGLGYPQESILHSFQNPRNLVYQPHAKGLWEAREEVAKYYEAKGVLVSPEQIFLTSSTSEGYSFLFRLLANVDDRVLFLRNAGMMRLKESSSSLINIPREGFFSKMETPLRTTPFVR